MRALLLLFRRSGRSALGVEAKLIVHLPLFGVGENVVGFLNLLEFLFSGFIAGIQVRMIFAGKLSIGLANLFLSGLARHAQQFVIILFGCCRHICDSRAKTKRPSKAWPSAYSDRLIQFVLAIVLPDDGGAPHPNARPSPPLSDWRARSNGQATPPFAQRSLHRCETSASGR